MFISHQEVKTVTCIRTFKREGFGPRPLPRIYLEVVCYMINLILQCDSV